MYLKGLGVWESQRIEYLLGLGGQGGRVRMGFPKELALAQP